MVIRSMQRLLMILFGLVMLLVQCGCSGVVVQRQTSLPIMPENEALYVVPFSNTLVPSAISEPVFNDLIDTLNDSLPIAGIKSYVILKDDLATMSQDWLSRQVYLTGDIWSYQENAGCCSTEIKIKARLNLFQSGSKSPVITITLPQERFFEHDLSTLEKEREIMARNLAREMYYQLVFELKQLRP